MILRAQDVHQATQRKAKPKARKPKARNRPNPKALRDGKNRALPKKQARNYKPCDAKRWHLLASTGI